MRANGGPVLASPDVIPIFFADEDPTRITKTKDFRVSERFSGSVAFTDGPAVA